MKSPRECVVEIINKFYNTNDDLKSIHNQYFQKNDFDGNNRNRITILSKDAIRWKGRLDWYITNHLDSPFNKLQPKLLAILEVATYELLLDDKVPTYAAINSAVELTKRIFNNRTGGLVNAVLRKISKADQTKKPKNMPIWDWHSTPKWLYQKWVQQYGEKRTNQLCKYYNTTIPLTIRRNALKVNHKELLKLFSITEAIISQIENSEIFYKVEHGGGILNNSPFFSEGYYSFQDRGAGVIAEVLDPQLDEIILDVCCAPGTKTNYIAELMQNTGKIYASDIDAKRMKATQADVPRLNNHNIVWEQKDASIDTFPLANRILIDAPCTGTGVIGRRPDIRWRRNCKQLNDIVKVQKSILNNVCKYLMSNGVLVYATCSLEYEENWQVVDAFLKLHDEFEVVSIDNPQLLNMIDEKGALKTFPSDDKTDGMFAVKMVKRR